MRLNTTTGNYEHLKDSMKGEEVYIVGSGVSLIGFDFNRLQNKNVIAVNHAYADVPWLRHHVFVDSRFLQEAGFWHNKGWDFDRMLWSKITSSHSCLAPRDNLAVIKPVNHYSIDPKTGFYTNKNSACFAISSALYMGASVINLVGIDCRFANKSEAEAIAKQNGNYELARAIVDSPNQLYGHSSTGVRNHTCDDKRHEHIFNNFSSLFDVFDSEIYNCSKWSMIKKFPYREIK